MRGRWHVCYGSGLSTVLISFFDITLMKTKWDQQIVKMAGNVLSLY